MDIGKFHKEVDAFMCYLIYKKNVIIFRLLSCKEPSEFHKHIIFLSTCVS
jgi:hypothetical protein